MQTDARGRRAVLRRVKTGELNIEEAAQLLLEEPQTSGAADPAPLRRRVEGWLAQLVAAEARVPVERVVPDDRLERHGFDSVMALNLVRTMEKELGKLPATLLFEHQTVASLANYLLDRHGDAVHGLFTTPERKRATEQDAVASIAAPAEREVRPGSGDPIAIVGLSARFPMADNLDEFWVNLEEGRDCVTEVPTNRWDMTPYFDPFPGKAGKSYTKWGGFINDVAAFDAAFFNISPREAERMDPQERLFLEEVWHALEDAGLTRAALAGTDVGVYVGVMYSQYQLYQAEQALYANPLYLGSSYASIANRVSHFLDLRGPSLALDSMCSSSLTAIHLACEALRAGDIIAAVVGGVNLTIHPAKHIDLSQGRFASSDGRCRSFGAGGDGYVPGEGVGVAILKPLPVAIADGDRVHAVIRGSAIGHGGHTNGYSVPNPAEQTRVIETALRNARVDPADVSYVEAHGTGTSLGDPIEVRALAKALGRREPGTPPCPIGSVKSNVGHLEAAAGIAGLAKLVLQLRHHRLVPSLHSDPPNPHLDLTTAGLRVSHSLEDWTPSANGGRRIAGLSSFGAGGANAHLVVEEFAAVPQSLVAADPHLIVLSAHTPERLRAVAEALAGHTRQHAGAEPAGWLTSAAYTLRHGREALDHRLALIVENVDDLVVRLQAFVDTGGTADLILGCADHIEAEPGPTVNDLLARRVLPELAQLWVNGVDVQWSLLDTDRPDRIALPGYPFDRVRSWPDLTRPADAATLPPSSPHPLLHRNESTFDRQRFVTSLRQTSPFVRDHIVGNLALLPAAAVVEMVFAAGRDSGLTGALRLEGTVLETPIQIAADATYEIAVELTRSVSTIAYTVSGSTNGVVHATGRLTADAGRTPEPLDVGALTAACGRPVDGEACYEALAGNGLRYGPALRVLEHVRPGEGQVLARFRLPSDPGVSVGTAPYDLHPALLDGAFQALIGFQLDEASLPPRIPFVIDEVATTGAVLPAEGWVHAKARTAGAGDPQVFDLTLTDDTGQVAAWVTGLAVRPVAPDRHDTVVLRPVWRRAPLLEDRAARPRGRHVLVFSDDDELTHHIRLEWTGARVIGVRPGRRWHRVDDTCYEIDPSDANHYQRLLDDVTAGQPPLNSVIHAWSYAAPPTDSAVSAEQLTFGFYSALALSTALVNRSSMADIRLVYAHPGGVPAHAAVASFHRVLSTEHPSYALSTVELPLQTGPRRWSSDQLRRLVAEAATAPSGATEVRFDESGRQIRELAEHSVTHGASVRRDGVYLVTGGLGGLGRIVAMHFARHGGARLVLSGRSPLDDRGVTFLHELEAVGGRAAYVAADCATEAGARRLVDEAIARFGRIDGVVHLAGVLRDGFVINKRREDAQAVLSPKIWGAYYLDRATRDQPLDFFALYSSATSVMGVAGQSDYAYANGFLNWFADWREGRRRDGERSGLTVSVAWPLWAAGGMDVNDTSKAWIEDRLGWVPLPSASGMELFDASLSQGAAQLAVFHGHRDRILRALDIPSGPDLPPRLTVAAPVEVSTPAADTTEAGRALVAHLRHITADQLKLPVERLDPRAGFERLGLESVMVMNITNQLAEVFGSLPKTLFFEYRSLEELARHLVNRYPAAVGARFGPPPPKQIAVPVTTPTPPAPLAHSVLSEIRGPHSSVEPIAIVGLSGRYPMAATLDEFWDNLKSGRDCITEVPATRWDHDRYFATGSEDTSRAYCKWGGFLDGVEEFDPLFFNISPREARLMDPQERLFLETAWHTFEDAGYARESLSGERVGVFVGVMYNQYQLYGATASSQARGFVPSSLAASIANRVSYVLGLTGPSLAVDTMCSSSLTAMHLACASIRLGDCDQALAGGVNTIVHPNRYLQLSQARFASTDGRCRSFGLGGDGYVPGEGVGAVLLKTLSKARADRDHIYGVIRGSALNHGGRSNGYTVPTPVAQAQVIRDAIARTGIHPDDIGYVEAHGTGTSLGDPIEIDGLAKAFAAAGPRRTGPCPIGSVKSNIGHLESAAGIVGITKVLLQFRHGELVPSIHAERLNPNIGFDDVPFRVQRAAEPWPAPAANGRPVPRIASVSSFGAGGANAHVVLEECPADDYPADADRTSELIVLSARTPEQLREIARNLADRLDPPWAPPTGTPPDPGLLVNLRDTAAQILGVSPNDIDVDDDLESLGLDNLARMELAVLVRQGQGDVSVALANGQSLRELGLALESSIVEPPRNGTLGEPHAIVTPGLRDIAFTLAVGREPQRERLGVVAGDSADLVMKLRAFCAGQQAAGVHLGRESSESGPLDALFDDGAGATFLASLRAAGDLDKLAQLWVCGTDRAATTGFDDRPARRVSLPTYPFARERYWVPDLDPPDDPVATTPVAATLGDGYRPAGQSAWADVEPPAMASAPTSADVPSTVDWDRTHRMIVDAMAAVLEISVDEFGLDMPHTDLGVDSVLAVAIVDRINAALDTELKPTDFFNYPTLRKLTDHVAPSVTRPALAPVEKLIEPAVRPSARLWRPGTNTEEIAVIGMSGRFPRARDLNELWANLVAGADAVREIPAARWDVARHWDPDPRAPGKTYSKWGSVLEDIDQFDPDFFGVSPREARLMDPQQRLFLMEAWRALEDAGYSDRALDGRECPVFVGTSAGDYQQLLQAAGVPVEGYTFTGSHPAVLASRLSYHLNLRGPSLAVDTSCSSSLMAVHLACEAIREGRAELAVAGGVAALSTPELHILASKAGMLSPHGRCRAFDDEADGFVPGEGVGVVVLKRLADAVRDGDHVHGVIAASGANQDGRTNGLTAPSAPSQESLLLAVYDRFGIDAGQIGYVECHGTGTRLGDPIEIEALTGAFRRFTQQRGHCAIGSIKSNLGHTLTVAGIAGLLKTLLCLKHATLVPSLHFTTPNRHIPFADGPFYVNTEVQPWVSGAPRLAAVSSFGFSGTNVHAVVREAPAPVPRPARRPGEIRLCPVSAKNETALAERLDALAAWLATEGPRHDWRDITHTLSAGRSHFDVRAAFLARDPADLYQQITAWRRSGATSGAPVNGSGVLGELSRGYASGADVAWETLYGDERGQRIPMPTYPFARERYWVPTGGPALTIAAETETVFHHRLHPDQPLVRDHIVDRRPLLPAAGHVELVHGDLRTIVGNEPFTLSRIVWLRPVFVTAELTIDVVIRAGSEPGRYSFEVRSTGPDGRPQVHSRGDVRVGASGDGTVDVLALRARCPQRTSSEVHYARFTHIGVLYGPHFTTVEEIRHGDGEALAMLVHVGDGPALPAGVLDGAIQSVAALQPDTNGHRPYVPFAMDEVHIVRPVPERSLAYVRQVKPGECDVEILDPAGRPCVVIRGLSYRELKDPAPTRLYIPRWRELDPPAPMSAREAGRVLVVAPPADYGLSGCLAARHADREVDVVTLSPGEDADRFAERLRALPPPTRVYFLGALDDGLDGPAADVLSLTALRRSQELGVVSLFRLAKALLAAGGDRRTIELVSVTCDAHSFDERGPRRPFGAAIFGLTRSLAKEQPAWRVGCVDVSTEALMAGGADAVASLLAAEPGHPDGTEVVQRDGRRWIQVLSAAAPESEPSVVPFRQGGTYLILGGAGGIGAELAVHLARRAGANLALLGRRPMTGEIQRQLDRVTDAGGVAEYFAVDAVDDDGMATTVAAVKARFGSIHGAFHSALVLRDARLDVMDEAAFEAVLAPKVRGAVVLAAALRDEPLDFLAFFSSAQSFSGNAGQANYAAACTFKDAFAAHLRGTRLPVHVINWGYWGEVGIVAKAGYRQRMAAVGVHSITADEGMRAIELIVGNRLPHAMVLKAEPRVLERFGVEPNAPAAPVTLTSSTSPPSAAGDWDPLAARVLGTPPDGDRLVAAHRRLDRLGAAMLLGAVQAMGVFRRPGEQRSAATLASDLRVAPGQSRLLPLLLDILGGAGYLERDGDRLIATATVTDLDGRDLTREGRQLAEQSEEVAAHVELLTACLERYPQLLRGEVDATTVMFPRASGSKVEGVYRGDPLSDRLNELVAHAVAAHVDERRGSAPVRILEVGAGTGGTTANLLATLSALRDRVHYVYTDISLGFLRHGRRTFAADHPYVEFDRLDIEKDPAAQGFAPGGFDIVVAANVLHATRNLRETLAHVRYLLNDRGRLVLSETTAFSPFATLTFGLLDGWWRAVDTDLRVPGSPLADVPTWTGLLREVGFDRSAVLAPARVTNGTMGQHVLVAESGGRESSAPVDTQRHVAAIVAEVLGRTDDDLDPDRPFTEYGIDSIILVELVSTLNQRLGIDLKPTALFDHPTLAELTAHLCARAGGHSPGSSANGKSNGHGTTPPATVAGDLELLQRLAAGELSLDDVLANLRSLP